MNFSYSYNVKKKLCALPVKSVCCRAALLCGLTLLRLPQSNPDALSLAERLGVEFAESTAILSPNDAFKCESCRRHFIRGIFLACGSVSDPHKSRSRYQLEFTAPDTESGEYIRDLLRENGLFPLEAKRGGQSLVYFRDNEAISDILNLIGAQKEAFDFADVKILRDYENNANRAANCDIANISRSVTASSEQLKAIAGLEKLGRLSSLSEQLVETAQIRRDNPALSMTELAELHKPPITKSGVSHRLKKIIEIYSESGEARKSE